MQEPNSTELPAPRFEAGRMLQAGYAPGFARYSADFDPVAGTGAGEIRLPVRGGADAAA